jgi:hypothetical protein
MRPRHFTVTFEEEKQKSFKCHTLLLLYVFSQEIGEVCFFLSADNGGHFIETTMKTEARVPNTKHYFPAPDRLLNMEASIDYVHDGLGHMEEHYNEF